MNGFLNYKPTANVSLDLSVGTQSSQTQKIFSGATYFTTNESNNYYANLAAKVRWTVAANKLCEWNG